VDPPKEGSTASWGHCYLFKVCNGTWEDSLGELGQLGIFQQMVRDPETCRELTEGEVNDLMADFRKLVHMASVGADFKRLVSSVK
jgi:hypothetical protein